MTTFVRARSLDQREERQRHILATAAALLADAPVAELTLTELGRRSGRSKAHILSYFGSREAVLLALLEQQAAAWLAEFADALTTSAESGEGAGAGADRCRAFSDRVARSLAGHPVLCDLLGAEAGVLERNVPVDLAEQHKRRVHELLGRLADLVAAAIPELGPARANAAAAALVILVGALWIHANPAAAVTAVYERDPSLAAFGTDFATMLSGMYRIQLLGLLADRGE